jgi:hypothetical protein
MDNFRRRLHSHLGAGAKTSLEVFLNELKLVQYNRCILGPVTKKLCSSLLKLSMNLPMFIYVKISVQQLFQYNLENIHTLRRRKGWKIGDNVIDLRGKNVNFWPDGGGSKTIVLCVWSCTNFALPLKWRNHRASTRLRQSWSTWTPGPWPTSPCPQSVVWKEKYILSRPD